MRRNKIFRMFTIAIVFALLVMLIPASPALAYDYDIDLDTDEGEIGARIDIDGND